MSLQRSTSTIASIFALSVSLSLIGCGSIPGTSGVTSGAALGGRIHGGQQPIVGAAVDLIAAGGTGYGVNSLSVLSSPVVTDGGGNFSLTGLWTCPSSETQMYVTASGGNPGAGTNNNVVLMSAIGRCGDISAATFIDVNEVSTVASVYSLAQFMLPGSTAVGTSATNLRGLVNAFRTVPNLMNAAEGVSHATTPNGNFSVPSDKINTLANIIATCVNSVGGSTQCSSLFAAAKPPSGTTPTDTLSAILDIAQNPGNSVTSLFNLASAQGPYQPMVVSAPNDWTLALSYTGSNLNAPLLPAVDGSGNVWVPNGGSAAPGTLSVFSPTGVETMVTGGGLFQPFSVAIDLVGNAWVANSNDTVSEHASNGTPLSPSTGFALASLHRPQAIALDAAGDVFVANANGFNTVTKLNSAGAEVGVFNGGGLNAPYGVAVDKDQHIWTANSAGDSVSKFDSVGTDLSSGSGFAGGGLSRPYWIAIDSSGSAWTANYNATTVSKLDTNGNPGILSPYTTPARVTALAIDGSDNVWTANTNGSIAELSNAGVAKSPATGYLATRGALASGIVIDASGNVWVTDTAINSLFEYVGAASPAVVPLQLGVKNSQLGQRP